MNEMIVASRKTNTGTYLKLVCGKTKATIGFYSYGVQVCCENAAHKTWKGFGKMFNNVDAALSNYKSPEMRSII